MSQLIDEQKKFKQHYKKQDIQNTEHQESDQENEEAKDIG